MESLQQLGLRDFDWTVHKLQHTGEAKGYVPLWRNSNIATGVAVPTFSKAGMARLVETHSLFVVGDSGQC